MERGVVSKYIKRKEKKLFSKKRTMHSVLQQ